MDQQVSPTLLNVEGMTCANCALGITKFLEKKGLKDVYVNFTTSEVRFQPPPNNNLSSIVKGIEKLGYKVISYEAKGSKGLRRYSSLEWRLLITLPFTIFLLAGMFFPIDFLHNGYVQLMVCLPVFLIGMQYFGKSALSSLRTGVPNMDVLIVIGSIAAFAYSVVGTLQGLGHDYMFYETAASIISLVLLGNVIEHRSVKQTTTAISDLTALQPDSAMLIATNAATGLEEIREVNTSDVRLHDLLRVNTGDRIPLDGTIYKGEAQIDESMITGESLPVSKTKGDTVIGGTINIAGSIVVKVSATGNETVLSNIIGMVKDAQISKPAIQRLADRISAVFVPVVLTIAMLTLVLAYFLFHISLQGAIMQSIAVLVIACPCAMGLATPTAVMVGLGRMAKSGILVKGGATIEKLTKVKQIVFDKTGTLTTGEFKIKEFKTFDINQEEVRSILFSLEHHSSHPIAKSILKELPGTKSIDFSSVNETKGLSISGIDSHGNQYTAGSYSIAKELTKEDTHNIYITKNGTLIGWVDLIDEVRPEAKDAIDWLKQNGIKTIMLSGDREQKCQAIASQLGLDTYFSEQSPAQKLELIAQLSAQSPTAMVGDGINDAPALAKADIGISLSNATQIAIQSAEVILLNGNLALLEKTFGLGKLTVRTIKQNLFWAFFYNVLAIPIAAVGFLRPIYAALSMAFSDVFVIGNSIRLKTKKIS